MHKKSCRRISGPSVVPSKNDADSSVLGGDHVRKITDAHLELQRLVGDMTMEESIEHFHRATYEIERLKKLAKDDNGDASGYDFVNEKHELKSVCAPTDAAHGNISLRSSQESKGDAQEKVLHEQKETSVESQNERSNFSGTFLQPLQQKSLFEKPNPVLDYGEWNYAVEKLIYLSSFSVTLMPSDKAQLPLAGLQRDDIGLEIKNMQNSMQHSNSNETMLHIYICKEIESMRTTLARMVLPCAILSTKEEIMSSLHLEGNFISLRIQYHAASCSSSDNYLYLDNITPESITSLTPCEALTNLQCRSCGQYLLKSHEQISIEGQQGTAGVHDTIIRNVCHLPSGYWDEITDYLTCYDGQPSIDFSAVGNVPRSGCMFEDEAILVTNRADMRNICVLAIDGYGEHSQSQTETHSSRTEKSNSSTINDNENKVSQKRSDPKYRGNRDWQEAGGGATLACILCCSTLGNASLVEPDAFRLLKHRLRASSLREDGKEDYFKRNTCASFVGKELIRYAESMGIFTFAVFGIQDDGSINKCLLLRVLSWNTSIAVKAKGGFLEFRRVVKIIFEKTDPLLLSRSNEGSSDDPMAFTWGGVDLCCPPTGGDIRNYQSNKISPNGNNASQASINLYLSSDEWIEMRDSLKNNSRFFSATVSKTTVMLKLGATGASGERTSQENSNASLTFAAL